MVAKREQPLVGFHFYVEVQGKLLGAFRECSGLSSESEKVEIKESGPKGEELLYVIPGRTKYPDIVLKRCLTSNLDMEKWRKEVTDGGWEDSRKNGSIVLYNQKHEEVARWDFENAWPSKLEGPSLNSGGNDVAVESMTLVVERLERKK
jgi:phage tail-like protein